MDDNALRLKMGAAGKSAVASNTISNVVKDLMQWYQRGRERRAARGAVSKAVCFVICLGFVALTVFMFAVYDIMVGCLLSLSVTLLHSLLLLLGVLPPQAVHLLCGGPPRQQTTRRHPQICLLGPAQECCRHCCQ